MFRCGALDLPGLLERDLYQWTPGREIDSFSVSFPLEFFASLSLWSLIYGLVQNALMANRGGLVNRFRGKPLASLAKENFCAVIFAS